MTEKIYLKIGRPKMNHFKLLLLLFTVLNAACNNQNVKSNANMQTNIAELQQIADTAYNNERWEDVINYYTKLTNQTPTTQKSGIELVMHTHT